MAELTPQQAEFARQIIRADGNATKAAIAAGYSEASASTLGYQLLQKPHVAEAIYREQRRAFTELASIATGQARKMLEDPRTPPGARAELIRAVWDRAGLVAPKAAPEGGTNDRPLSSFTLSELEEMKADLDARRQAAIDAESGAASRA